MSPEEVRARASVNLAAIERNCRRLRERLVGDGELCAVVKADGYGHGAVQCARAALAGGAERLAVATAGEAVQLREGGILDARLLVMGALTMSELARALAVDGEVVVWNEGQVAAVEGLGGGRVHVKLDSGMGRLGTRDHAQADRTVRAAMRARGVSVVGAMTHFATADELGEDFFAQQLRVFRGWADRIAAIDPRIVVHAANSAATLRETGSHFDMVRCGIAIYGMDPFGEDCDRWRLEPALELDSYVAEVKPCEEGQSAGYGRRFIATADTTLGVLPIGYGDGFRRACSNNGEALIDGGRYPIVGTVSMDNITVDLGPSAEVGGHQLVGRRATLIGRQGNERITAEDVARRIGTINYEITCGLTERTSRRYHRDGRPLS